MSEKELVFRPLRADEIEVRVQSFWKNGNGCWLLLYKDARCDQRVLDESVGPYRWQREHYEVCGNLFCRVGILDTARGQWVWKADAGAPSNTEAQKGHASDAFKRACFNWGIGRELYTAPQIGVKLTDSEVQSKKVSYGGYFRVTVMDVVDGVIVGLVIVDQDGEVRFSIKNKHKASPPQNPQGAMNKALQETHDKHHGDAVPEVTIPKNGQPTGNQCKICGEILDQKVYEYSMKNYAAPLCREHQKMASKAK